MSKPRFLYGESMGGAVSLLIHRRQPLAWTGAVLIAPMVKVRNHIYSHPITIIYLRIASFHLHITSTHLRITIVHSCIAVVQLPPVLHYQSGVQALPLVSQSAYHCL